MVHNSGFFSGFLVDYTGNLMDIPWYSLWSTFTKKLWKDPPSSMRKLNVNGHFQNGSCWNVASNWCQTQLNWSISKASEIVYRGASQQTRRNSWIFQRSHWLTSHFPKQMIGGWQGCTVILTLGGFFQAGGNIFIYPDVLSLRRILVETKGFPIKRWGVPQLMFESSPTVSNSPSSWQIHVAAAWNEVILGRVECMFTYSTCLYDIQMCIYIYIYNHMYDHIYVYICMNELSYVYIYMYFWKYIYSCCFENLYIRILLQFEVTMKQSQRFRRKSIISGHVQWLC